eukprot:TRINITY_DN4367_c0_g1_i3.p1 TRINITY_DN4367_c0_g1~~TRINITY_DN4367_c0_g1_i3.p1  ORF type:complete len:133 (+),score=32.23 TRINITY_DN4367_c0_g1_i3:299-697(+)
MPDIFHQQFTNFLTIRRFASSDIFCATALTQRFSITPLGTSQESSLQHTVEAAARVVVVRGLRHELHPAGTLIEGSMDECFEAVKECITDSLKRAPRIIVGLRADVHPGAQNRLHQHQVEITRILGRIEGET